MNSYTLSETMNELRKEGYTEDFNLHQNCLECRNGEFKVLRANLKLTNIFGLKVLAIHRIQPSFMRSLLTAKI